jgi:hypothetical protein
MTYVCNSVGTFSPMYARSPGLRVEDRVVLSGSGTSSPGWSRAQLPHPSSRHRAGSHWNGRRPDDWAYLANARCFTKLRGVDGAKSGRD